MDALDCTSHKWQLRHWPKGVPYGTAPELTPEDIKTLRNYLLRRIKRTTGRRDLLIFDLFLNTGCLIGELYALRTEEIAYYNGENILKARSHIIFKNRKPRPYSDKIIPVSSPLKESIESFADLSKTWVCWSQMGGKGHRMEKNYLSHLIERWGNFCGMKIRAHSFRKTFLKQLWYNGIDIFTLISLSGHKSMQGLSRYLIPDEIRVNQAITIYGNLYNSLKC